jgi:cysteinyl-tRNA synthetase
LQSHYRKNLVFSWEGLDNAVIAYNKLVARIAALDANGEICEEDFSNIRAGFVSAMDNDLNTSLAITALYDALKAKTNDATKLALIKDYDTVLSLGLAAAAEKHKEKLQKESEAAAQPVNEEDKEIVELVAKRTEAKKAKNFALADSIREQLKEMGVLVEDTPQGPKWKRI